MKQFRATWIFWALALPAVAGTVFTAGHRDLRAGEESVSRIVLDRNRLRMDLLGEDGEALDSLVFDGDRGEVLLMDHEQRQYTVVDQAFIEQAAGILSQARRQLEQLPPAQRALLEGMLGRKMETPEEPPRTEWRTGKEAREVAGVRCLKREVYRGGNRAAELWVAAPADAGARKEDLAALRSLAAFYRGLAGSLGAEFELPVEVDMLAGMEHLDGFPMAIRTFDERGLSGVTLMRNVEQQALENERFRPPPGYREQKPLLPAPGLF